MKKHIFSIGLLCSVMASFSFAQSHVDALRYSQHTPGGTARSVAMGGAFGALGGDFSALSQNPAGLGVYRSSEFTFTPEFYFQNTTTRYFGNEIEESKFNFNISNLGYVGVFEPGSSSSLTTFNFGIGFNRIANFHRNSVIEGHNEKTSLGDYMALEAYLNGLNTENVEYFQYFSSDLFYRSGVIEYLEGEQYQTRDTFQLSGQYFTEEGIFLSPAQTITISESGKINEWVFSFGFNFSDILYLGGTFSYQPIYFNQEKSFKEVDAYETSYEYFTYNEEITVRGSGYTAKLGVILRPIPMLRLGAAFHVPVSYVLDEDYETHLTVPDVAGAFYPLGSDNRRIDVLKNEYRITTPFKAIGSAAVVVGKSLILSGDIEYLDYSDMRMKDSYNLEEENQEIRRIYDKAFNIKLGSEIRFGDIYFRGGFGYYGSPYSETEENWDANRLSYSGGFGIRNNNMFFDVAYQYVNYDERDIPYKVTVANTYYDSAANIDNKNIRIMTTIGFKF